MEPFIIKNFVIQKSQEGVTLPTISTFKLAKGNSMGTFGNILNPTKKMNVCIKMHFNLLDCISQIQS